MEGAGDSLQDGICPLCLKNETKYTCPRCNVRYCSVECYKGEKHMDCSESFYKDCFIEGLKDQSSGLEEKRKIMEMISRVEEETEGLESDDEPDLAERLEGLDLDCDAGAIWKQLTEKERKEFDLMSRDGRLGHLVEVWTPWWNPESKQLIQDEDDPRDQPRKFPKVKDDIIDLAVLLPKSKPSSGVKYSVVGSLYAYCFVCRLHNGDHWDTPVESAQEMLIVSDLTNKDVVYNSPGEVIQSSIQRVTKSSFGRGTSAGFSISIIEDIINIIRGPSEERPLEYLIIALSELLHIIQKAKKLVSKGLKSGKCKGGNSMKKDLFACEKKLEFYLSWSQRLGMSLHMLVPELVLEHSAAESDLRDMDEKRSELEEFWGGKQKPQQRTKLIEEIT
ncbi:zinc finger HIT domain-containing protein 2-like [Ylistrum balloti]|uniref:zinc finger HIT domain-containing protein 2-like n=1 Tax=Ylistrum balloti TaxID=509963 RepID=UPI0029058CC5|nr:zinc finger HIT domain-containing protein 2-like [Ylistrum balloti]